MDIDFIYDRSNYLEECETSRSGFQARSPRRPAFCFYPIFVSRWLVDLP